PEVARRRPAGDPRVARPTRREGAVDDRAQDRERAQLLPVPRARRDRGTEPGVATPRSEGPAKDPPVPGSGRGRGGARESDAGGRLPPPEPGAARAPSPGP